MPLITPKFWVLRLFAGSWATLLAALAYWASIALPGQIWFLPAGLSVCMACGVVFPVAMRWPYRAIDRLFAPIGQLLSLLMMFCIYFGLFAPFALVLRLVKWDPLRLRSSASGSSGWVIRPAERSESNYDWQY